MGIGVFFVLKWIFVLACCFRQTSKRHLLLWLTDGEDELDDESPSIKNQRRLAFPLRPIPYLSKPLMLPLFYFVSGFKLTITFAVGQL